MDPEFDLELLRRCLELLSDEDNSLLTRHYFRGLSAAEIARLLNITRSAVLVRMHRARKRLRNLLEEHDRCFAA